MINGLFAYLRSNGNKDLLSMAGGVLYYLNGSTWTPLDTGFTDNLETNFVTCPLNDKVYIDNGTDGCHRWDRASTVTNACLTDLGAGFPYGKVRVWYKNHMFVMNKATLSGSTYTNRIYFSDLGNPDNYTTATNYFDTPGGGNVITAGELGDALAIFKENSVMFLTGYGTTDWIITTTSSNIVNVDENVGCIAPKGVTKVGNELWFIDKEGNIRRLYQTDFDAFRKDIISTKVQGTLNQLNMTYLHNAKAWTWDNKVYFAIPTGTSTTNNTVLVFDILASKRNQMKGINMEAWTVYTGWQVNEFCSYPTSINPDLYIGSGTLTRVYLHDGEDDDGVAIDARWDSKDDNFDKEDNYKRYKFGYIKGTTTSSDVDVELYASVNLAPWAKIATINLQSSGSKLGPTGSFLLGPTGGARLGGAGRAEQRYTYESGGNNPIGETIRHSIRHNAVAEQPTIESLSCNFKTRNPK